MKQGIFLYFLFNFILFSCGKNNGIKFVKNKDFNKLNEKQLLVSISKGKKSVFSPNYLKSNFNWNTFWLLFDQRNTSKKIPNTIDLQLLKISTKTCSYKSYPSIINLLILFSKKNTTYSFNKLLNLELLLSEKCGSKISNIQKKRIAKIHTKIFKEDIKKIPSLFKKILILDKKRSTSSLSPNEIYLLFRKFRNINDINLLNSMIKIHQSIAPLATNQRSIMLKTILTRNNSIALNHASIIDIIHAIKLLAFENSINILNQKTQMAIINKLLSKFKTKYPIFNRYSFSDSIMSLLWEDYTKIFTIFNTLNFDNKKQLLVNFNKLNKLFENTYNSHDVRSSASNFLFEVSGEFANLANSHLLRLDFGQARRNELNDKIKNDLQYNEKSKKIFNQLLIFRIKLFNSKKQETSIDDYCNFLHQTFKINSKKIIELNNIENILNSKSIGCYKISPITHNKNRITTNYYIPKEDNLKPYQLKTIKRHSIDTNIDFLIQSFDTNITIETKYYNGPIWHISSRRLHRRKARKEFNYDAKVSIIPFNLEIDNNKYILFYNYSRTKAKIAPSVNEVLDVNTLLQGYPGSNFKLSYQDKNSHYPIVINNGSFGQQGPETILSGQGYSSLDINNNITKNDKLNHILKQENIISSYGDVKRIIRRKLLYRDEASQEIISNNFKIKLNTDLSNLIQTQLCQTPNFKLKPAYLCLYSSSKSIYKRIDLENIEDLETKIEYDFKFLLRSFKLRDYDIIDNIIEQSFTLYPNAKGYLLQTPFPNGKLGLKGIVKVIRDESF